MLSKDIKLHALTHTKHFSKSSVCKHVPSTWSTRFPRRTKAEIKILDESSTDIAAPLALAHKMSDVKNIDIKSLGIVVSINKKRHINSTHSEHHMNAQRTFSSVSHFSRSFKKSGMNFIALTLAHFARHPSRKKRYF